jgi:hypothetical protein
MLAAAVTTRCEADSGAVCKAEAALGDPCTQEALPGF